MDAATSAATSSPAVGRAGDDAGRRRSLIDGQWALERPIGSGAFGKVFLAKNARTGDEVALKIFDAKVDATGYLQELGLFFSERHPNIVPTLSFGYTEGRKYLVYEYVDGGNLRDMLVRTPRLSPQTALDIAAGIARGLAHAHRKDVVHRDLKPENILLTSASWPATVRICDFGLSVRCDDGETLEARYGSPAYMAPEQLEGSYDRRVDFYAVGVMLYEMLFGRRPYSGDIPRLKHSHSHRELPLPEQGPEPLLALLRSLLSLDPAGRPATADALLERIEEVRGSMDEPVAEASVAQPSFRELGLQRQWRARLKTECQAVEATEHGCLLIASDDRVIELAPDGSLDVVARPRRTVTEFARGGSRHRLAWVESNRCMTLDRRTGRVGRVPVELDAGPRTLTLSPDGHRLAVSTPDSVTVVSFDGAEPWKANVTTYGTVPPVVFSLDGELVWIAPESPRTRIIALDRSGRVHCEMTPGGSDLVMAAIPGGLVLGARGRQSLFFVSSDGFVEAEVETETPVVDVGRAGGGQLAVLCPRHVEIVRTSDFESVSLVEHPDRDADIYCSGRGLHAVRRTSRIIDVQFSTIACREARDGG